MGSQKLDLYKKHASEYATPRSPTLLKVGKARYLAIDGRGRPGGDVFRERLGALYNVAFTIKMTKKLLGRDYAVCKLEGLWWGNNEDDDVLLLPSEELNWKLLIRTPNFIRASDVAAAVRTLSARGKPPIVKAVQLESLEEGRCVQMLHVGPYSGERETLGQMQAFAEQQNLVFHGLHHEIYLSDPRRVASSRLRTILRRPVHMQS